MCGGKQLAGDTPPFIHNSSFDRMNQQRRFDHSTEGAHAMTTQTISRPGAQDERTAASFERIGGLCALAGC
jgi:hypothetical protein